MAIDGFRSQIVAESTMPEKNNLIIYEEVYRQVVKVKNKVNNNLYIELLHCVYYVHLNMK